MLVIDHAKKSKDRELCACESRWPLYLACSRFRKSNPVIHAQPDEEFSKILPKRLVVITFTYAMTCLVSAAQESNMEAVKVRLDQVASSYTAGNAFMGSVLVASGNDILLNRGYGMADLEWGAPDSPDVKFRLGSLTKQFTAALVLLLQEDGKLRIDDPIGKYLPSVPKSWETITLAELLRHTSGIPDFTHDKNFGTWSQSPHSVEEKLAFFRDQPLHFEPGSNFEYSNSNYEVLGAVIEKVVGEPYGELLRKRIFMPLSMKDSGLDTDQLILPKRAQGYMVAQEGLVRARSESMSVPWAAGSIYSTTGDLLRWERGLFNGKILSETSLNAMMTPGKGNYGLGVYVSSRSGLKVITHSGAIEGFNTFLSSVPERQITIVVLSNVNGTAPDKMGRQLLDVALGKSVVLGSERKAVPISKEELAKFEGSYEIAPGLSFTLAVDGGVLTIKRAGGSALPLFYEGIEDGRPSFYASPDSPQIQFVPDARGIMTSMIFREDELDHIFVRVKTGGLR
jgi:CubicO group peptidase (beta-lactamase class C family)